MSDIATPLPTLPAAPTGQVFGIIDPDYGRIFTISRLIAWQEGYSVSAQGTFTRDLDLLAVPWTERARSDAEILVRRIAEAASLNLLGKPEQKPHGRLAWTLTLPGFSDPRFVDLSVFPPAPRFAQEEPLPPVAGDVLPPVGSPVLIHLASLNTWVRHVVVGYYVWPALDGQTRLQRVNVRVADSAGDLNARMLCDVRRIDGTPLLRGVLPDPAVKG